jgi:hypothetical protein
MKTFKQYIEEKILIPRRTKEERNKRYSVILQKQIQDYINKGSIGDLNLNSTPITSLPDNLKKVSGSLDLRNTQISKLYTKEQIRKMVPSVVFRII